MLSCLLSRAAPVENWGGPTDYDNGRVLEFNGAIDGSGPPRSRAARSADL
jgi:hypothetical protein